MFIEGWLSVLATVTGLSAGVGAGTATYEAVIGNTSRPLAAIAIIAAVILAALLAATPFMVVITHLGLMRQIAANTAAALPPATDLPVEYETVSG